MLRGYILAYRYMAEEGEEVVISQYLRCYNNFPVIDSKTDGRCVYEIRYDRYKELNGKRHVKRFIVDKIVGEWK